MPTRISRRRLLALSAAAGFTTASYPLQAKGPGQLQLIKAIQDHLQYSAGFRQKFKTGIYSLSSRKPSMMMADKFYASIKSRLAALSEPSFALIHHFGPDGRMNAWLLDPTGIRASSQSDRAYAGLGYLQRALRVDRLMDVRAAVPRNGEPVKQAETGGPAMSADDALDLAAMQLLGPDIIDILTSETGRLLVMPARDTGTAPYAALRLADGVNLIERYSIVVVPDIQTLSDSKLVHSVSDIKWPSLLMAGNPDLSEDKSYKFANLPGAEDEVESIRSLLGAPRDRTLIGGEATLQSVVQMSNGYGEADVIYLASHAIANSRNPMDGSFVALTDGHLTGQLLRGQRFAGWAGKHPLVVLSACQTALGKTFDGGSYGLSRAFFSAGAAQVVSSLWNVDDYATKELMTRFMDRLFLGHSTEQALRRAQIALSKEYLGDPGAWASFNIFGMPAER